MLDWSRYILVAIIASLPALISVWWIRNEQRRLVAAQATSAEIDAVSRIIKMQTGEISRRNEEIACLQTRITQLEKKIRDGEEERTVLHETLLKALRRIDVLEVDNERLRIGMQIREGQFDCATDDP